MEKISVLLATHNGADVLGQTLNGYVNQDVCGLNWEIIVVDNASNDSTYAIIEEFKGKLPLKALSCSEPGKNKALNSAIDYIEGDFIIVTDDDAIPQHNFLKEWALASKNLPEFDLFGGSIQPVFSVNPPEWMVTSEFHFDEIFATRNLSTGIIRATEIFGPNMAVRSRIFAEGIYFNENIGPNGSLSNYPMGSETEFCRRVEKAGHPAYFVSKPLVKHIVRPHQITEDFWKSRAYKHGLGIALQQNNSSKEKSLIRHYMSIMKLRLQVIALQFALKIPLTEILRKNLTWQFYWASGYLHGNMKS